MRDEPLRPLVVIVVEIVIVTAMSYVSPLYWDAGSPWRELWIGLVLLVYAMIVVNLVLRLVLRLMGDHDP